jgi:uncharacterized damage-inducible protein DinB
MLDARDQSLLEALLDSWDRNNTIVVKLLRALPEGGLEASAVEGSPSIAKLFRHIHFVRLVFVLEDAPEFARPLPDQTLSRKEWTVERDRGTMERMLNESAQAVRDEGHHHGQMKLALKVAGLSMDDQEIGPVTWGLWMDKTLA